MKAIFILPLFAVVSLGVEVPVLERPVAGLRLEQTPLPAALRALGRACDTTILAEPDVSGEVTLDFRGGSLREALDALTAPQALQRGAPGANTT